MVRSWEVVGHGSLREELFALIAVDLLTKSVFEDEGYCSEDMSLNNPGFKLGQYGSNEQFNSTNYDSEIIFWNVVLLHNISNLP